MREWARTDDDAAASRELTAALTLGMKVPRTAMV